MDEQTIASRYRKERLLGRGGMGQVWLCHDTLLQRQVAVKEITSRAAGSRDRDELERFGREARLAANLAHPHVVTVFDLIDDPSGPLIVMEYIEGESLGEKVARLGRLGTSEVIGFMGGVCEALALAHAQGIIHRDIKPANILVGRNGVAKLTDFGIGRFSDGEDLTQSGAVLGTVAYMAPEVALGERATAASDMYAVGASLFTLLEGHPPHAGPDAGHTPAAQLLRIVASSPPEPVWAGELTGLVRALLERDPARRPTARETARLLAGRAPAADTVLRPTAPTVPSTILRDVGSATPAQVANAASPAAAVGLARNRTRVVRLALGLVVVALVGVLTWAVTTRASTADPHAVSVTAPTTPTVQPSVPLAAPPSPAAVTSTVTVTAPAPVASASPLAPSQGVEPEAGTYTGVGHQRSLTGMSADQDYQVEFTLSEAGSTVRYPQQGCMGTLSPHGWRDGARVYVESVKAPQCDDGGTWVVYVRGPHELDASYSPPSHRYVVTATLVR